jgi:hypothetical protein
LKEKEMKRLFVLLLLLLLPLALTGCSDGNSDAPPDNSAHPLNWIRTHPADALAAAGFADCIICHGDDLHGNGEAVSCYSCHSYNDTPPFIVHPADWDDPYRDHRGYAAANGFSSCKGCHGSNLRGTPAAPSCFSTSFNGLGCHPDGPGQAPHPLDGSYLNGANHGPEAKADLTVCQACHGQSGGPGSNPRFNIGISSAGNEGCEGCHGDNYAHPADWAGPNSTYHYSAGNIQNACTLCHGVDLDGIGGVGVSCRGCHNLDTTTDFTLDCTYCHGYPPNYPPVDHGGAASASHDTCVVCHGMKESGGSFAVAPNYLLFDKGTDTPGDHWDGTIDMNSSPGYNQDNFGCDLACHGNDIDHQLTDSGLPVELKSFGFGDAAPHPLDGSFIIPSNHGPAAKGQTASFPSGMVNCRPCHASGDGANPRFDVGVFNDEGCEYCHNDQTAHPSVGARDNVHWYDNTYRHGDIEATKFTTMCTLCHGVDLGGTGDGGVGPACVDCHTVDPVANPSGCVSCHKEPPDGSGPAGDVRPNRQGRHGDHDGQPCSRCHNGAGFGTAAHFDTSAPANVNFLFIDPTDDMSAVSDGANTTCTGTCHISAGTSISHDGETWYPVP